MEKLSVEGVNTKFLNHYNASAAELLAEAMEQFGLIDEDTRINDSDIKELLKTLKSKKQTYELLNRKGSFITKIGTLLLQRNIINNMQLKEALNYQKHTPIRMGEILVQMGFVEEDEVTGIIEEQKKIRDILERVSRIENIEVLIDYREPLFEKTIGRDSPDPFFFAKTVPTSDVSEAIIDALTTYFSNERLSSVRWRAEITGIRISINLNK